MFVRDFIAIDEPFESVAPQLLQDAAWLEPIAYDAVVEAIRTLRALNPGQPLTLDLAPVTVHCARGPVRIRDDTLVMPLRWDTNVPAEVLPALTSDLEVVPLGRERSQVVMNATYRRADAPDHTTRRAVDTGVRAFLQGLASKLHRGASSIRPSR